MKFTKFMLTLVCLLAASAETTPSTLPGDVLLVDPTTSKAFLWIHAASGIMEPVSGYKPEQVYRLLLEREQACWSIHLELVNQVKTTLIKQAAPILPIR